MFAGDNSKPAADASYRNLLWENFHVDHSFNLGAKIVPDKEIGTIDSWGPFYHVSFDLIIHSLKPEYPWSRVLEFLYENEAENFQTVEQFQKVPSIFLHRSGFLDFWNSVDNHIHNFNFNIEPKHWYNIIIEQKAVNGKVI